MRRSACGRTAEGCCAGQRCCMAAGWGVVCTLCVCTGGMSEFWSSCPWLQGLHHMCYRAECCAVSRRCQGCFEVHAVAFLHI